MSAHPETLDGIAAPASAVTAAKPSDKDLAAWRDAAQTGALPSPARDRWQPLRAGVVNLWEFDVAEYWFADGRTQFVGQNQSGKSTLMALTTLILLAGDLDRQLVDTFGQQHKAFRYYVEPTNDPQDRRDTGASTSRGWAWVEYGRVIDGQPCFFTSLLYAQAKRGANDFVRTWAVCGGTARVRAGLDLHLGAAARQPSDLANVPGFRVARNGTEYKSWVAHEVFGFADQSRLDAVVRMLKVLRTPHLGQRLDPDFFTAQMREALPAIAQSEIDELAEGWEQLDALAADRGHAETARNAVASYVRRAWNPWADAVLRRHADGLAACVTRFDNVTRVVRAAEETLGTAREQAAVLESRLGAARAEQERVEQNYDDLLRSPAYQNAYDATARVEQLKEAAERSRASAGHVAEDARNAGISLSRRTAALTSAQQAVADVAENMTAAINGAQRAAVGSGLPADAQAWTEAGDIARLDAAVSERRQHLAKTRKLLSSAEFARQEENSAASRAKEATDERARRAETAVRANQALAEALQNLSNDIEGWAATLGGGAPSADQRSEWITAVTSQSTQPRPCEVLGRLLRDTWLTPTVTPLRERAAVDERQTGRLSALASERDAQANAELAKPEPEPAPPVRWTRRHRPGPGPGGAPLWRLLDPHDDVPGNVLDHVEAALDATGLLDAWVTPDGTWLAERDGADIVLAEAPDVTISAGDSIGVRTLATVLRPAGDAGTLSARVSALLNTIGYQPDAESALFSLAYGLSADGRWRTPATVGQAGASEHGAELIGTAARNAARDRRVRSLRAEAEELREQATALRATVADLRARAEFYDGAADRVPQDAETVRAALAVDSARRELLKAQASDARAHGELEKAQLAARNANSALLTYTGDHALPMTAPALEKVATALDAAATAIANLNLLAISLRAARQAEGTATELHHEAAEQTSALTERAEKARRRADRDQDIADNAEESLGQSERVLLQAAEEQRKRKGELKKSAENLGDQLQRQQGQVASAEEKLANAGNQRRDAEQARDAALAAWWIPVDAGLAAARRIPVDAGRALTHALSQARAARETLRPPGWPDAADATAEKDSRVTAAWSRLVGNPLVELRAILEASGGRGVAILDADENRELPAITILVDNTGEQSDPFTAISRLNDQVRTLSDLHDQKMQQVLIELLSSTFVEHLRDRLTTVLQLTRSVNTVLSQHPTGADLTTLRLKRLPAEGQRTAFGVLQALESEFIDSEAVQNQVRAFLEQQIREAQDQGKSGATDWKQHLSALLDYRRWFDIITEYRVGDNQWRPLTKEIHGKDSGGGKVVTLLQPLVATLVALYGESRAAPRPLWLDEAFTGVDDTNRSTMLALLVTFDLDFLLAGPATLVTTSQVPIAAVWFVNRAPAPDPGVDLSLMLWAGNALTQIEVPTDTLASTILHPPEQDADSPNRLDFAEQVAS